MINRKIISLIICSMALLFMLSACSDLNTAQHQESLTRNNLYSTKMHETDNDIWSRVLSNEGLVRYTEIMSRIESLEKAGDWKSSTKEWKALSKLMTDGITDYAAEAEFEPTAVYNVVRGDLIWSSDPDDYPDGNIIEPTQSEIEDHRLLFSYVKNIIPEPYFSMIRKFDASSDGYGGKGAMVTPLNDAASEWLFTLDPADTVDAFYDVDHDYLNYIIVHELGHLVTLNNGQMDNKSALETYTVIEGKLAINSYMNQFYQRYWKDTPKQFVLPPSEGRVEASYDKDALFSSRPDHFISDYAATCPAEDIAESFAYYVLKHARNGDDTRDEKTRFFEKYPELKILRTEVIRRIQ